MIDKHFSPGPWRYDFEPGYCGELIASNGECIATFTDEPSDDNANLIAAAPTMLDVLLVCRKALEPYNDIKPRDWKSDREALVRAYQAICNVVDVVTEKQD